MQDLRSFLETGSGRADIKAVTARGVLLALGKAQKVRMSAREYRALADFRYALRTFQRYSEQITRRHGLTPLQYQLLLQIRGFPEREKATIGELAERLQAKHHGVVALATRCEILGLIERQRGENDQRVVYLRLRSKGVRALERLALLQRDELRSLREGFLVRDLEASD